MRGSLMSRLSLYALVVATGGCGLFQGKSKGDAPKPKNAKTAEAVRQGERAEARARIKGTWASACEGRPTAPSPAITGEGSLRRQLTVTNTVGELAEFNHFDQACAVPSYVRRSTFQIRDFLLDGARTGLVVGGEKVRHEKLPLDNALLAFLEWSRSCGVASWGPGEAKEVDGEGCRYLNHKPGSVISVLIPGDGKLILEDDGLEFRKGAGVPARGTGSSEGAALSAVFQGDWMEACEKRSRTYLTYPSPNEVVIASVTFHDDGCTRPSYGLKQYGVLEFGGLSNENAVNFKVGIRKETLTPYGSATAARFNSAKLRGFEGWKAGEEHVEKAAADGAAPLQTSGQAFRFFPGAGPGWGDVPPVAGRPDFAAYDDAPFASQTSTVPAKSPGVGTPVLPVMATPAMTPATTPTQGSTGTVTPGTSPATPDFEGEVTRIPAAAASTQTHSIANVLLKGRKVQSACRLGNATIVALDDSERGVYRSTDGGRAWFKVTTGLSDLACATHSRVLGLDQADKIVLSADAGSGWQSIGLNRTFLRLVQGPTGRVVGLTSTTSFTYAPEEPSGAWSTRNDLAPGPDSSITRSTLSPRGLLSIAFDNLKTAYRYDFEGNSARTLAPTFPAEIDARIRTVVFGDAQKGLMGYWNGPSQRMALKATVDGGGQWSDRLTAAQVADSFGSDDRYVFERLTATADGGYLTVGENDDLTLALRVSTDHGVTWQVMAPPVPLLPADPNRFFINFDDVKILDMTGDARTGSGLLVYHRWSKPDSQLVLFDPK